MQIALIRATNSKDKDMLILTTGDGLSVKFNSWKEFSMNSTFLSLMLDGVKVADCQGKYAVAVLEKINQATNAEGCY